jgi:predicted membrane-bound spermidine synthase
MGKKNKKKKGQKAQARAEGAAAGARPFAGDSDAPLTWRAALAIAFLAGVATMAIEMTASRLLAPAFGTSLAVWTNIIGVMMAALAAGYTIGGRVADKNPSVTLLASAICVSGLLAAMIPIVAKPLLAFSVETLALDEFPGSFVGTVILFGPPIFLLGIVNPFVIRLAATDVTTLGDLAGRVYSVSTLGSLLGTFLPVLITIPLLGTSKTMYVFSALLIVTGLWCARLGAGDEEDLSDSPAAPQP